MKREFGQKGGENKEQRRGEIQDEGTHLGLLVSGGCTRPQEQVLLKSLSLHDTNLGGAKNKFCLHFHKENQSSSFAPNQTKLFLIFKIKLCK